MESSYIDTLHVRNPSMELTPQKLNRLEEVFECLRGRCLINVDRSYFYWKEILAFIKKMGVESQIVIKSTPNREQMAELESIAPHIAYMPILKNPEEAEILKDYKINYCMAELVFSEPNAPIASDAFLKKLKSQGILLWGNAIAFSGWLVLAAGRDDYKAITGNPDDNWGWFVDKGFDVIQTDWPMLLREYLDGKLSIGT
jgi:glycerophosphoryl diester phosphodiesterase